MDLLGKALEDYYSHKLKSKFFYYKNSLQKEYDEKIDFDLDIYFRSLKAFYPLERTLIDLSYGNILDIGSSTGYYIPYLMNKGHTMGIEISPRINNIAKKKGLRNCFVGDFFTYKFNRKFDTITLVGNDIALTGTLHRLKRMLKKFGKILNEKGQVLLIIRHIRTLKYWQVVYTPQYNGHIGKPAKYLFLNALFFKKFALKYGFHATIIRKDESRGYLYYLVRLVKSTVKLNSVGKKK